MVAAIMERKEMTFDEFRSFQERERQRKKEEDDEQTASGPSSDNKKKAASDAKEGGDGKGTNSGGIGEFMELPQVQSFVVVMLVLDTFSALGQALLALQISHAERSPAGTADMSMVFGLLSPSTLLKALNTFSGFTLVFFAFEVGLILAVFGSQVSGHWGYLLDAVLVGTQLYKELSGNSLEVRVLNLLRFWRIMRLTLNMVTVEKEAHNATQELLRDREAEIRKAQGDIKRAEVELAKEKEARAAVDDMLNQYKDDLDTMNEALKIAAMDIVEVAEADEDLLSDDEDLDVEVDGMDDEGFTDAPSGKYDKARNKAEMYAQARKDKDDLSITSGSTMASSKKAPAGVTFVVNNDGSFQQR